LPVRQEVDAWLASAERDLSTARYLFKGKKFEPAAFFCQQSVEKAFKAIVIERNRKLVKTHDLVFLARSVHLPPDKEQVCKELTMAYIATRYPDVPVIIQKKERARQFLKFAKEVLEWAREQL